MGWKKTSVESLYQSGDFCTIVRGEKMCILFDKYTDNGLDSIAPILGCVYCLKTFEFDLAVGINFGGL